MKFIFGVILAALISLVGFGNAYAEAEPEQNYVSIMGSYVDDDDDRALDDGFNSGQISVGYVIDEYWNVEALFAVGNPKSSGVLRSDEKHTSLGVDIQRVFYRSSRISPYIYAGVGVFNSKVKNVESEGGGMYSAGAGVLIDVFSNGTALRADFRHRVDDAQNSALGDNMFSLGFQVPFGKASPAFVDSDGDGVSDGMDRCPNTPAGTAVDAYGCELDSDNDGVKDSADRCPDTPAGVTVDSRGCAMDSDGDGVTDDKDRCPDTVRGAKVDAYGCEMDGDSDGVVDRLDECPDSPQGAQVDVRGCEIKEEIALRGVNFESNSDRLLPGATTRLDQAAATLLKNPTIKVEVAGHTDSDGAAEYNESLSARRAKTVQDYLAANGVADDRMTVRGYGEAEPVAPNNTAAGKAENRRVVLRITER